MRSSHRWRAATSIPSGGRPSVRQPCRSPYPSTSAPGWTSSTPSNGAAATHPGGPLLILAGAGTGKTTTLCARVAWLVAEGVAAGAHPAADVHPPRGAGDAAARARRWRAGRRARARRDVPLGRAPLRAPARGGARPAAAASACSTRATPPTCSTCSARSTATPQQARASRARARCWTSTRAPSTPSSRCPACVAEQLPRGARSTARRSPRCSRPTRRASGRSASLDLDDLLLYWRALARDEVIGPAHGGVVRPRAGRRVPGRQRPAGRHRARAARARRDVTAVGDDFQAIYGFRAASAEHILDFPDHFPDATVVTLERNYRSTQPILDAANALAAQARRAFPKRLRAEREGGARPALVFCRDESAQAAEVCDRVLEAREQGMELREQAVLMRTSHDTDLLELELTRRRDPVRQVRRPALPRGGARQGLHRAAAAGRQPRRRDRLVPRAAAARGRRPGDGARRALDVLCARRRDASPACWPAARRAACPRRRAGADALVAALLAAREEPSAGARAERLRDALAPLIEARYPDGALRLHDLEQLVAAAQQATDLRHFVGELVLDPPQSSADLARPPHLDEDYLVLSTIHSAKGLEWQAVHVLALYDGNFPAGMSAGTSESIDEERRPALRGDDARAAGAAPVRPGALLPPPARPRRRPRLRQAVALPHRRGARLLRGRRACRTTRCHRAARRWPPRRRITVSPDSLFD